MPGLGGVAPRGESPGPAPAPRLRQTARHRIPAAVVPRSRLGADHLLGICVAALPAAGVFLFGAVEEQHLVALEAAALAMGAGALVVRAWRGERPLPAARVTLPVLLLAALPALQLLPIPAGAGALVAPGLGRFGVTHLTTISVHPHATALALVRWLSYAAYLIAALEALRRPRALHAALGVVAALGVAEAAYGIGNLFLGNGHLLWTARYTQMDDATGTFVNRNHYAAALTLCLPALLARRWLTPRTRRRHEERAVTALYLAGATAIGLAILLSHSRGGIVSLAAAIGLAAVLAPSDAEGRGGRWTLAALAGLIVCYGAFVGLHPVVERFGRLGQEVDRLALWHDAARLAADFPMMGAGAGTFEGTFPAYRRLADSPAAWAHAHQDYLELAAEGGLLALVLFGAAVAGFVAPIRRALQRATGRRCLALAALVAGVAAVMLHAAVDFPLHIPGIVFLLLLVAAAALDLAATPA